MTDLVLSSHQQTALDWLVTQLTNGAPLIALRGLAGTGKSTMIPALRNALRAAEFPVAIGAPTHRAAMILRRKGLGDADTVHSLALTPFFSTDYARAIAWLGEEVPCRRGRTDLSEEEQRQDALDVAHADVEGLPWLLYEVVKPELAKAQDLRRQRRYPAKKRLESLGITGRDYFTGFGAKAGHGVLIIDEASMVGTAMLALCQRAYPQICLVGDPGQLPPVKDTAHLATVPGFDLTEIHRQAADSPIVKLAYRARNGEPFWREKLTLLSDPPGDDVAEIASAQAAQFLTAPLIVWKNDTRKMCTHAIRSALGFARELLYAGEPLVCRSTSKEDRADGFFNNSLFTITEADPSNPRRITVVDALERESTILAHIEELDGDGIDPRAIPFRLGYALTAHTAQGGEWPTVYISLPDLRDYTGFCHRTNRQTESAQWCYTAITRAKDTLMFLNSHTFLPTLDAVFGKPTPPAADALTITEGAITLDERPFMATPPTTTPPETAWPSLHPVLDDIADPVVPASVTTPPLPSDLQAEIAQAIAPPGIPHEQSPATFGEHQALLYGFCQALQGEMAKWMTEQQLSTGRVVEMIFANCKEHVATLATANEHSQYQLANALTQLQERGLVLIQNPYVADVTAMSPQGFPVTLHVVKTDVASFIAEIQEVTGWLASNSFTPPPAPAPY